MVELVVALLLLLPAGKPGRPEPLHAEKQAILKEGFLDEKRNKGRQLGKRGGPEARKLLMELLQDENYWNRLAAVDGLLVLQEPDADRALIKTMLEDHMVASDIESGFGDRGIKDSTPFIDAYKERPSAGDKLLPLLGNARDARSEEFLRGLLADRHNPKRAEVLKTLSTRGVLKREDVLAFKDELAMREAVLGWLAQHGTKADVPYFLDVIARKERSAHILAAYHGIARLGDARTQEEMMLGGLNSRDDALMRGAIVAFPEVHSDAVTAGLCRVGRDAAYQDTRLSAARMLASHPSKAAVPCLIAALKEKYTPTRTRPIDAAPAFLTLGLTTLLAGLSEDWNEGAFTTRQAAIARALTTVTGQDHGPSYRAWKEWALEHAYSVDGENLIQRLFSSRPSEREKAVRASLALLHFSGPEEVGRAAGLPAPPKGRELHLALARLLVERGVIKDEPE